MKPKKAIKELRKQLEGDPTNVVLRIRLASLLRDIGQHPEAVDHYLAVAKSYDMGGRIGQAIAVCKGVLEFAPQHPHAQQVYAYLKNRRIQGQAASSDDDSPPASVVQRGFGRDAKSEVEDVRRKRPTSMPTPLTDRGSEASLPGLRTTSTGGRTQRASDSLSLSTRRLIPDNTVPGAPPKHEPTTTRGGDSLRLATESFRLQDLSQAGQKATSDERPKPTSRTRAENRLSPAPPLRLPPNPPPLGPARSHGPGLPLPLAPEARPQEAIVTRQFGRDSPVEPPALEPPALEPPPAPTPPLSTVGKDAPALEDATIVDASFELAVFMAEQEAREEDLPDLPGALSPTSAASGSSKGAKNTSEESRSGGTELSALGPLQGLPRYAIDALLLVATSQSYPEGAMIVSEGEALTACRLVQSGQVQILKHDPAATSPVLKSCATVGPGSLLGASGFMDSPEMGAVLSLGAAVAMGQVDVVEIPVSAICKLRERFPAAGATLELFYRERCIDLLMSTSPLFESLTEHDRAELVGLFEPVRAASEQPIVQSGSHTGGFHLVLSGQLEIKHPSGGTSQLHRGDFFGDVAVLRGVPSSVAVRASCSTELAHLDAQRFYELISKHPEVWAAIWRQSGRPELAGMQLVLGTAANF
ncbi:MAG: cyclic nucleotide-binding domain-containing protein [Myxococcales bacterium]|nr:cyclic nucleotide-binding domain-containing protein [Myxococcales bacterium]